MATATRLVPGETKYTPFPSIRQSVVQSVAKALLKSADNILNTPPRTLYRTVSTDFTLSKLHSEGSVQKHFNYFNECKYKNKI